MLLKEYKPDIVVITGHDAYYKKKGDLNDINKAGFPVWYEKENSKFKNVYYDINGITYSPFGEQSYIRNNESWQ